MDIKIQILGIFPSINNNNDKIFFKISNGKLYSLNECIKDNIIIPFFLQFNIIKIKNLHYLKLKFFFVKNLKIQLVKYQMHHLNHLILKQNGLQ